MGRDAAIAFNLAPLAAYEGGHDRAEHEAPQPGTQGGSPFGHERVFAVSECCTTQAGVLRAKPGPEALDDASGSLSANVEAPGASGRASGRPLAR